MFKISVAVFEESHTETILVLLLDIGRSHADGALARVVEGVYQVLDDIHPGHGAAVRQIYPYAGLDGAVKSLHHDRLLLAFTGKVLDIVAFHQSLEVKVKELFAMRNL